MRFKRYNRVEYTVTDRKRAALVRRHRREQQEMPLLAELIVEQQPAIDTVMAERVRQWAAIERRWRDMRAADWHRARSELASLPAELNSAMLQYWNEHRWLPGDPLCLADAIHRLRTGSRNQWRRQESQSRKAGSVNAAEPNHWPHGCPRRNKTELTKTTSPIAQPRLEWFTHDALPDGRQICAVAAQNVVEALRIYHQVVIKEMKRKG